MLLRVNLLSCCLHFFPNDLLFEYLASLTRRSPADAARYRVEQEADARKAASIAAAQADAEKARLTGEGEKARRTAEADALRAEGTAQAAAILATGEAEAQAMNKRAPA